MTEKAECKKRKKQKKIGKRKGYKDKNMASDILQNN